MNLFGCDEKGLAVALSEDPELYNSIKKSLEGLRDKKVLNPDYVERGLSENLSLLERANSLARNSDYFIFGVYDSWAEETAGNGSGYVVYQKVNEQMIQKLGLTSGVPFQIEQVFDYLRKNKIKRVFTTNIPSEGYFGLEYEIECEDGHFMRYQRIFETSEESVIKKPFKEKGIELIILD